MQNRDQHSGSQNTKRNLSVTEKFEEISVFILDPTKCSFSLEGYDMRKKKYLNPDERAENFIQLLKSNNSFLYTVNEADNSNLKKT